jgi:beta-glucanase (GH16 family)
MGGSARLRGTAHCLTIRSSRAVEKRCTDAVLSPLPTRIPHWVEFQCITYCILYCLCFPLLSRTQTGADSQWIALNRAGAPNSNLQCFTPNNVSVSGGNLVITSKSEAATCSSFDLASAAYRYTSGFVSMRTFNYLYGTLEVRAKFGGGASTGSWPIIWMEDASCQASDPTGTDDRCNGQEIDVAEILNSDFTRVNQQIHVNDFAHNDGCTASATDVSQSFHVYQLVWSAGSLVFKVDGASTCTINRSYVPSGPMYVKINNFVGNMGGAVNSSSLPWTSLVDYVKVTQGSVVVFNDDFNLKATVQSAQPTPPSSYHPVQTSIFKTLSHWRLKACIICLAVVFVITAFRFCRPRRTVP